MGRRLIGDRIPKGKLSAEWAASKCELCGRELGYEDAIRSGKADMACQHLRCSFKKAVAALQAAAAEPADAANIAVEVLEALGEPLEPFDPLKVDPNYDPDDDG